MKIHEHMVSRKITVKCLLYIIVIDNNFEHKYLPKILLCVNFNPRRKYQIQLLCCF